MSDPKTVYLENGGVVLDPADQIDDEKLTKEYRSADEDLIDHEVAMEIMAAMVANKSRQISKEQDTNKRALLEVEWKQLLREQNLVYRADKATIEKALTVYGKYLKDHGK